MIDVMARKGLSLRTQAIYLASVCSLARHWGRDPQALSADEVRSWVVGRIERGLSPRTTNTEVSALRLFFADAMGQPEKVEGLIQGIKDLRCRTATLTAYVAGLRIAEVVALQVGDVRGEEGLIRIRNGKGGHERMAHLPGPVLDATGRYWSMTRPRPSSWLL